MAKSRLSEALMLTSTLRQNLTTEFYQTGTWPPATTNKNTFSGTYVSAIEYDGKGSIHIQFGEETDSLAGKTLSLTAALNPAVGISNIIWNCGFETPPAGYQLQSTNKTDIEKKHLNSMCR